jgi:hypothetical protein
MDGWTDGRTDGLAGWQTDKEAWTGGKEAGRQAGRQADRQTGRQADRQTGRQADRQAGRQAGRQADRQTGRQAGRPGPGLACKVGRQGTRIMQTGGQAISFIWADSRQKD